MLQIRKLREAQGLTQEGLARKAGLSVKTVVRADVGIGEPSGRTLKKLSRALGVPIGDLFAANGKRKKKAS